MLKRIGLEQYFSNLEDNGFDELDFLEDLTDQNLFDVGVLPQDHRAKVCSFPLAVIHFVINKCMY